MFNWFNKNQKAVQKPEQTEGEKLREEIKYLQGNVRDLKREKQKLVEQNEEMKFKKRLEQEEVVHLNKLNEQRMKQELDNEKASLQKKYQEDISIFKEQQRKELVESLAQFHSKMESRFSEELKNLKEVYGLLMEKLPNVNFAISKHIGEQPRQTDSPGFIETSGSTKNKC